MLLTLAILLAAVLLLSYVAVRWVTRPLQVLAAAADELGRDINRPPLPEDGPVEVQRAAHAFNTMQTRLVRFIDERTRLLAAMSHDLKTPLTRMRLRAELLEDEQPAREIREGSAGNGGDGDADARIHARTRPAASRRNSSTSWRCSRACRPTTRRWGARSPSTDASTRPWSGSPQLLKRCISNLVDNAVLYGQRAEIRVDDGPDQLTIRVRDHGPGIPEGEIDKVFEPFYRLEGSRSRETGGTGLGLSIARNIAQAHGGDVRLRNREDGGLEAILTLPWSRAQDSGLSAGQPAPTT